MEILLSPYNSVIFCFIYLEAILLGIYTFRYSVFLTNYTFHPPLNPPSIKWSVSYSTIRIVEHNDPCVPSTVLGFRKQ